MSKKIEADWISSKNRKHTANFEAGLSKLLAPGSENTSDNSGWRQI